MRWFKSFHLFLLIDFIDITLLPSCFYSTVHTPNILSPNNKSLTIKTKKMVKFGTNSLSVISLFESIPKIANFRSQRIYKMIFKETRSKGTKGSGYRKMMGMEESSKNAKRWIYFVCQIKKPSKLSFYKAKIKNTTNCSQFQKSRTLRNLKIKETLFYQGKTIPTKSILPGLPQSIPIRITDTSIKPRGIRTNSFKIKKVDLLPKCLTKDNANPSKYTPI